MHKKITFNKVGYEPFLDFLKAYSILCVLVAHTFPYLYETGYALWYGMQVPIFILIQVFHVFKKDSYSLNIKKLLLRIFLPFLLVQIAPIAYTFSKTPFDNSLITNYMAGGGYGPGSYFPWVYLQMAVILAIVKPLFHKGSKTNKLIIALLVCEGFEIIYSLAGLPDWLYRLLPIRYFFLIYLGWLWVEEGIVLNVKTIVLSLLSMGTIIYFEYFYTPSEPWFYDTSWRSHRWPCYFYVSTLLCGILHWIYEKIKSNRIVESSVKFLSKCSYEIFLIQMLIVSSMPEMDFIQNVYLRFLIRTAIIFVVSIVGGYYFNLLYGRLIARIDAPNSPKNPKGGITNNNITKL